MATNIILKTVLGLAVITAAGVIGYLVGKPDYCCAFSGNRDWIDYLIGWSGPIAGISAIAVVFLSDHLSKKQRQAEIRSRQKRFSTALKMELTEVITKAARLAARCDTAISLGVQAKSENAMFGLPISDSISANILEYSDLDIATIASMDIELKSAIASFHASLEENGWGNSNTLVLARAIVYTAADYVTKLRDPDDNTDKSVILKELKLDGYAGT